MRSACKDLKRIVPMRGSRAKVSTHAFANPVVAVALGVAFAGEHLNIHEFVGGVIVLTALATIPLAPNSAPGGHSK